MTTVYLLHNASEELLYVGIADQGMQRLAQHASTKAWWTEVASARFEHYDTREEAQDREVQLIIQLRPKHNVHWNRVIRVSNDPAEPSQPAQCKTDGCTDLVRAKGLCRPCYQWEYRHGKPQDKRHEWHSTPALL